MANNLLDAEDGSTPASARELDDALAISAYARLYTRNECRNA